MKHISVPVDNTCELINITPVNPLISKCQIKVCYVGDGPNRNGSIITKQFAQEKLAPSLPGCPIVGYFNKDKGDFEEHNKIIDISNGKFDIIDTTRPYGFVDLHAKVWFEDYTDDYNVTRTYLVTEGYLWTGAYPESQQVIDQGKSQSMELNPESMEGTWAQIGNNSPEFFIINEALVEKLCILGDDVEPCFEGANVQSVPANDFSLTEDFKNTMFAFVEQMKEILDKGGNNMSEQAKNTVDEFAKKNETPKQENPEEKDKKPAEDNACGGGGSDKKKKPAEDNACGGGDKKKKANNSLHTDEEFDALNEKYTALVDTYATLDNQFKELTSEVESLREFKSNTELEEKKALIDSFSYLDDEDKKNVREHINDYSLKDIKAELSIICVDKKVQFNLADALNDNKEEQKKVESDFTLSIGDAGAVDNTPAWLKKVVEVQENM
jgi:hypothetical protein